MFRRAGATVLRRGYATEALNTPVIVSATRTPIGSFGGSLASFSGAQLGAVAVKAAVERAGIAPEQVEEALLGNVVSAGMGQAPARQAVIYAGLPQSVSCTTVNKVCASGMKTVMFGAQAIMTGYRKTVVAGGFESMSNIPYYLSKARNGYRYGNGQLEDGILKDGLWDVYGDHHMGIAGEHCATTFNFTRQDQDEFAINSYKKAAAAYEKNAFADELVPVEVKVKKDVKKITSDEEYLRVDFAKVPGLRPAFKDDGTVTAANASSLNDGASALVLTSLGEAQSAGLRPLAKIIGFADSERAPIEFTIAPADAITRALKMANLTQDQVDLWEINEAFSVVVLANIKLLNLNPETVNVNGGAVALGHPIGASGARIIATLAHTLKNQNKKYGVASICNGGGGASAVVLESF